MKRASILPVMIDTYGNAFFLLGRVKASKWVDGHCWNDFGGLAKDGESIEEVAAREFVEESNGVLVSYEDIPLLVHSLVTRQYVLRIQNTFVVRFQWNPAVEFTFNERHSMLSSLHNASRSLPLSKKERLSLASIPWIQGNLPLFLRPALKTRKTFLPRSIVQTTQRAMNAIIGTHNVIEEQGPPVPCILIQYVRREWVEIDSIRLFSIPQLKTWMSCVGLTCPLGQHLEINHQFKTVFRSILHALQFTMCQ